jgi:hypothetical protein
LLRRTQRRQSAASRVDSYFAWGCFRYFCLALQLFFLRQSESMGNHDSEIVDADAHSVD